MTIWIFVFRAVAWFVWRQIEKYGRTLNWDKVKRDAQERVRKLIPGSKWDDGAAAFVGLIVDLIRDEIMSFTEVDEAGYSDIVGRIESTLQYP